MIEDEAEQEATISRGFATLETEPTAARFHGRAPQDTVPAVWTQGSRSASFGVLEAKLNRPNCVESSTAKIAARREAEHAL